MSPLEILEFNDYRFSKGAIGFVYLVECLGLYKIGVTRNIESRLKSMDTDNPFKKKLIHCFKSYYYIDIEKCLQDKLRIKNVKNEWFDLSIDDIQTLIKIKDFTHPSQIASLYFSENTGMVNIY